MSIANDIAQALATRVQSITTANGFNTNIGAKTMRGRRRIDPGHLPCAVLIERDDNPLDQTRSGDVKLAQKYIIEGHD